MKNLYKTIFSIASIAACLSSESFAMTEEIREGERVAVAASSSTAYFAPQLEARQSYE